MISFKQWLVLLGLYTAFMLAGAVMFLYLELGQEYLDRESLAALKHHVKEVMGGLNNGTRDRVEVILWEIGEECGHDFLSLQEDAPLVWTLWNSFFFTFTVITTIGFGHMAPKTPWGKVACIMYAFIGVPFNGIVVASLADIFSHKAINWDVRQWGARYKTWVTVLVDSIVFLVPGLVVFLVLPSFVLMFVEEDWSYLDAFYFSFITLTTIGFGDHVAGQQETGQLWEWVYKIVMVIWFIFGLGYIIMIITFIQKALKSKKVMRVERRMKSALKKHVSKVHRDLGAVRRAINNSSDKKGKPPATASIRRPHPPATSKEAPISPTSPPTPSPPLTPFSRPRSASESDLTLAFATRQREIEGMRVMLDFIERLLEHQETQAITNITNIMTQHTANEEEEDDDEDDAEGEEGDAEGGKSKGVERGHVNAGYTFGDISEVGDWLFPTRMSSQVEELLYLLVAGKSLEYPPLPDIPFHTVQTPTVSSPTPQSSPPPSYHSLNPRPTSLPLSASPHQTLTGYSPHLTLSPALRHSTSPYSTTHSLPPSPYHTITLLSQLFSPNGGSRAGSRGGSGAATPRTPSTPRPRSPFHLSPASRHPALSLPSSPLFTPTTQHPTQREEEREKEETKF